MEEQTPRKIHYIWFGGAPLNSLSKRCLESWKRFCPNYEIVRWDESNFDLAANRYCREAYEAGKWAFASDYARLWVLAHEGGIYMDTDVELLKPLDDFLCDEAWMGFERSDQIMTGLLAARAEHELFQSLLTAYSNRSFVRDDGSLDLTPNVAMVTAACVERGLALDGRKQVLDGLTVYPQECFCPMNFVTREIAVVENTYAFHHFDGSWLALSRRLSRKAKDLVGPELVRAARKALRRKPYE